MLARAIVYAILATPCLAYAQFSLVATQIGPKDEPIGDSYTAACAKDACRVTLPVYVAGVGCVLNVRVSAPTLHGMGTVLFAAGPCQGGYQLDVYPGAAAASYQLDAFGAMTRSYVVPLVPHGYGGIHSPAVLDDGVERRRPDAVVRLDLVAPAPEQNR